MKKNTLQHFERLKSPKWIEKLFARGSSSVYEDSICIRFLITDISDYPLKAGFSVSKRLYKRAHDRNKYKRWLRESYRTKKSDLLDLLIQKELHLIAFVILQKKVEDKTFQDIDLLMQKSMDKLYKTISKIEPKTV